jgi:uncharacterized protein (DUF433 family)
MAPYRSHTHNSIDPYVRFGKPVCDTRITVSGVLSYLGARIPESEVLSSSSAHP